MMARLRRLSISSCGAWHDVDDDEEADDVSSSVAVDSRAHDENRLKCTEFRNNRG
jgi:hypothetical protein